MDVIPLEKIGEVVSWGLQLDCDSSYLWASLKSVISSGFRLFSRIWSVNSWAADIYFRFFEDLSNNQDAESTSCES